MLEKLKNLFNIILFLISIIILISLSGLICYHFYAWINDGEMTFIPLINVLYHGLGFDPTVKLVEKNIGGFYILYLYILKIPLFFWLLILSMPAYIKIKNMLDE